MCTLIKRMKTHHVYNLFKYDLDYVSQEEIPLKRKNDISFPYPHA